jgi:hypothetical protein
MKAISFDFENLAPVESYTPPELPMLDEKIPELLKKLPTRWQNNVKVLAFITLTGTIALAGLTGCGSGGERPPGAGHGGGGYPIYTTQPANQERDEFVWSNHLYDVEVRLHFGGEGSAFYVAHITEQEALGIIRAQLEAAGLDLSAAPPDYEIFTDMWIQPLGLNLFDVERNVAIAYVDTLGWSFFSATREDILREFAELNRRIAVGAFFDSGQLGTSAIGVGGDLGWGPFDDLERQLTLSDEENVRAQSAILNRITEQADAFIYELQERGILEIPRDQRTKPDSITVTLNGEPLELDVAPVKEGETVMVPFLGVFEALGMEVTRVGRIFTAKSENLVIELHVYERFATVNGERAWFHPNAMLVDASLMVPLRFVANNSGVFVRWNERTQTVIIESE